MPWSVVECAHVLGEEGDVMRRKEKGGREEGGGRRASPRFR